MASLRLAHGHDPGAPDGPGSGNQQSPKKGTRLTRSKRCGSVAETRASEMTSGEDRRRHGRPVAGVLPFANRAASSSPMTNGW
jgi:hypothetical protein